MRRLTVLSLLAILALAESAYGGAEGRIAGKVLDAATGRGIPGANIHISAVQERKIEEDAKSGKDGSYTFFLVDATIRYKFTVTAPGYAPYSETLKLNLGETMHKDFTLSAGTGAAAPEPESAKADPSVTAYNDGAQLFNAKKYAEAVAKFEEAVKGKPDLIAGWEALARAALAEKDYAKAIDAATKALDLAPDESDMFSILYDAYTATGDKAKAAEWKKKMPVDAVAAYNEAATALNKNDDAAAEPLLKQAIAADPKLAPPYYELGMLEMRAGRMPEAKVHLEKYLELDPKGKNAETAKQALAYMK